MKLIIVMKDARTIIFDEKELDCSSLTVRGHASNLIKAWKEQKTIIHEIDDYTAICLPEIIAIRVV